MVNIRFFSKRFYVVFISVMLASMQMNAQLNVSSQVIPLPHAYAHNDYWHKRPLFDALENGFTYIEADVYLRHSKLLVAHRPPLLRRKRKHTIEGMYLNPLFKRLTNPDEIVQTPLDSIVLMIDIKSNGKKTYAVLRKLLNSYKSILSTCEKGKVTIRNLTLVLTGHRPLPLLKSEDSRYVFADADLRKINSPEEDCPQMFTTASCKYSSLISWKGKGEISPFEKERLKEYVDKAHLSGTKVRLWGSPENEAVWRCLRNCGVDLINTDKLLALKKFFMKDSDQENINLKFTDQEEEEND